MVWSLDPALTGVQVRDILLYSAHRPPNSIPGRMMWLDRYGDFYNRLNALSAVQMSLGTTPEHNNGRLTGQVSGTEEDNTLLYNARVIVSRWPRSIFNESWQTFTNERAFFSFNLPLQCRDSYLSPLFHNVYTVRVEAPYRISETFHNVHVPAGVSTILPILRMVSTQTASERSFMPFAEAFSATSPSGTLGGTLRTPTGQALPFPATLEFHRGIYLLEPHMLYCPERAELINSFNM